MLAHGMTDLGYLPCRAGTLDACLASVEQESGERTFDLSHLTGETIMSVEPHAHGFKRPRARWPASGPVELAQDALEEIVL